MPDQPSRFPFPDLCDAEAEAHPEIRLSRIIVYCVELREAYANSSRRWLESRKQVTERNQTLFQNRMPPPAADDDYLTATAGGWQKSCEFYFDRLGELTRAIISAGIGEALDRCEVLRLSSPILHLAESTNWEGLKLDLVRIERIATERLMKMAAQPNTKTAKISQPVETEESKVVRAFTPRFVRFFPNWPSPGIGRDIDTAEGQEEHRQLVIEYQTASESARRKDIAVEQARSNLAIEEARKNGQLDQLAAVDAIVQAAINETFPNQGEAGKMVEQIPDGEYANDPITTGIDAFNRIDALRLTGKMAEAERASGYFQRWWIGHSDPKVTLYFKVFFRQSTRELRTMAKLNPNGPQRLDTEKFNSWLWEAETLGIPINDLPEAQVGDFSNAAEADAALTRLRKAIEKSVRSGPPQVKPTSAKPKRKPAAKPPVTKTGLVVDAESREARYNDKRLTINAAADFNALKALHDRRGKLVTHLDLVRAIKPESMSAMTHSLKEAPPEVKEAMVHIRKSLSALGETKLIETVKGQGYKLRSPDE